MKKAFFAGLLTFLILAVLPLNHPPGPSFVDSPVIEQSFEQGVQLDFEAQPNLFCVYHFVNRINEAEVEISPGLSIETNHNELHAQNEMELNVVNFNNQYTSNQNGRKRIIHDAAQNLNSTPKSHITNIGFQLCDYLLY